MSAGASLIRRATAGDLALVTLAVCGVLLFGAHVMEHVFAMVPCPLCLMQRLWFYAAGLFVVVAFFTSLRAACELVVAFDAAPPPEIAPAFCSGVTACEKPGST